jgi:hypothetical protein
MQDGCGGSAWRETPGEATVAWALAIGTSEPGGRESDRGRPQGRRWYLHPASVICCQRQAYDLAMGEESVKPSKVLSYFRDHLAAVMPVAVAAKLATYDPRIAQTTTLGDFHRCTYCASWAHRLSRSSDDTHHRHLLQNIASWTNCLGAMRPDKKVSQVELAWVDEAIGAARSLGNSSAWTNVPWEELLQDLIALDGIALDDSSTDRTIPEGWTCLIGMASPAMASTCAAILSARNIAVTKRNVATATLYGLRQPPEQLLVRNEDAQTAHDILVGWAGGTTIPPTT